MRELHARQYARRRTSQSRGRRPLAPLYTPLRTDEENISIDHLALGGINVYLDESLTWWRRMPGFVRRLVDQPWLVRWAARFGGSTRPEHLGRLAVAMFRGDDGPLKDDVQQMLDWLQADIRPDIVHLSNVMLAGLARPLKERLGVPVVATLTGEDWFLEKLPQPYYDQALAELRARAADIDCLIALSRDYADFMAGYLRLPREKIEVVRPGLNLEGFPVGWDKLAERAPAHQEDESVGQHSQARLSHPTAFPQGSGELTIGFLGRICEDKGPHLLLDAMAALDDAPNVPPYRIRLAGYLDRADRHHLKNLLRAARRRGMADRFQYVGELDRAGKIAFLQSLDVLCLPSLLRESKGLPALEAWACGVPAVLPDHGAFSELVADTGGGLLYDPQQPDGLAAALLRLITDAELAARCGRTAQQAVYQRYTAQSRIAGCAGTVRKNSDGRLISLPSSAGPNCLAATHPAAAAGCGQERQLASPLHTIAAKERTERKDFFVAFVFSAAEFLRRAGKGKWRREGNADYR